MHAQESWDIWSPNNKESKTTWAKPTGISRRVSCSLSGCPRELKNQPTAWANRRKGQHLPMDAHPCLHYYTTQEKRNHCQGHSINQGESTVGITQSCLIKTMTTGLFSFKFLFIPPSQPSLPPAHAGCTSVQSQEVLAHGGWTMRHVQAQQPNTIQAPCFPQALPFKEPAAVKEAVSPRKGCFLFINHDTKCHSMHAVLCLYLRRYFPPAPLILLKTQ